VLDGDLPRLRCIDGWLVLLRVKPPGRREMGGAEFLRGHRS
jgi:hypothetical protein